MNVEPGFEMVGLFYQLVSYSTAYNLHLFLCTHAAIYKNTSFSEFYLENLNRDFFDLVRQHI